MLAATLLPITPHERERRMEGREGRSMFQMALSGGQPIDGSHSVIGGYRRFHFRRSDLEGEGHNKDGSRQTANNWLRYIRLWEFASDGSGWNKISNYNARLVNKDSITMRVILVPYFLGLTKPVGGKWKNEDVTKSLISGLMPLASVVSSPLNSEECEDPFATILRYQI